MQVTITIDNADAWAVTEARKEYNKGQPETISQLKDVTIQTSAPAGEDGVAPLVLKTVTAQQYVEEPNPDRISSDEEYVQFVVARQMVAPWTAQFASRVRVPTGTWMQRWTPEERKAVRQMGLLDSKVEAWLDQLDASEYVNLTNPDVNAAVPAVCAALEKSGVIAVGTAQDRAAAILARPEA